MGGRQQAISNRKSTGRLRTAPLIVLCAFLALLLIGIALDEPSRVLEQARTICLGCIGIG